MSFTRLYDHVCGLGQTPIRVEVDLVPKVLEISSQDEILFTPVELDDEISLGHIKQYRRSNGVYDQDSTWVTEIRYDKKLNVCWSRFVCAKELMHVFDTPAERTDTIEKLERLLNELETDPPMSGASEMYQVERYAQWMALAVLCPLPTREARLDAWKGMAAYDVALSLRIPEVVVPSILGDNYPEIVAELLAR